MTVSRLTSKAQISWLADRRSAGELDDITWMYFCASDILTFHTVIRSLFDEVSAIAARVPKKKGVVPDQDFHRLREWTKKNVRSDEALGRLLAELIRGCDWFNELRDIRDDLVHRSARTIVFLEPNRVLFQVHVGLSPRIFIPSVMFNANVVDFPSYSALLMARTAAFLEQFAEAVFVSVKDFDAETGNSVQSFHVGLGVLKTWLRILLEGSSAIQS